MAATKHILILPDAWHVPDSYFKLTEALRHAGFHVHVADLPSVNQRRPPSANLATDTLYAQFYAGSLVNTGRQLIVLMHGYGGQVGTNALHGFSTKARSAKGLPGGISHLIYMAAYAQPKGKSIVDRVSLIGFEYKIPAASSWTLADDKTLSPNYLKEQLIRESSIYRINPDEMKRYMDSFVVWNGLCMQQEISNTPAWSDDVQVAYIHTTDDLTLGVAYQRIMVGSIEKATGKLVKTVKLNSGHAPNLTATKAVVDAIVELTS